MDPSKALRDDADRFKELAEQFERQDVRQTALKIADRFERLAGRAETWGAQPGTHDPHDQRSGSRR
jgi:hypothetical protein